jgi:hypothetical protein
MLDKRPFSGDFPPSNGVFWAFHTKKWRSAGRVSNESRSGTSAGLRITRRAFLPPFEIPKSQLNIAAPEVSFWNNKQRV